MAVIARLQKTRSMFVSDFFGLSDIREGLAGLEKALVVLVVVGFLKTIGKKILKMGFNSFGFCRIWHLLVVFFVVLEEGFISFYLVHFH